MRTAASKACSRLARPDRDETGIDGVGFAGIDHALALRGGEHGGGADEEGILEVGDIRDASC